MMRLLTDTKSERLAFTPTSHERHLHGKHGWTFNTLQDHDCAARKRRCCLVAPLRHKLHHMKLTTLTSAQFAKIAGLLEKKEALLAQISDIDQQLSAFDGGGAASDSETSSLASPTPIGASGPRRYKRSAAARAKMAAAQKASWAKRKGSTAPGSIAKPAAISTPAPSRKVGKGGWAARGALKEAIVELIKGAGKAGIAVKDVAEALGIKYTNAAVWFGSTGKKVKGIKRIARGTYAWVG